MEKISANHRHPDNLHQKEKINQVAQEFETILLKQVLHEAMPSMHDNSLIGGGYAEEMWHDLLIQQYSEVLAEKNMLGVQKAISKYSDSK